jgi:hypothetical protein
MTKPLGEGASAALDIAVAADALAMVHGESVPKRKRRLESVAAPVAPAEGREAPYHVTTVRLTEAQYWALEEEAISRRRKRGRGKPDVSEVLRELVDAWRGGGE